MTANLSFYEKEEKRLEKIIEKTKKDKPYLAQNCLSRLMGLRSEMKKIKNWVEK